jgi:hypothetical protein
LNHFSPGPTRDAQETCSKREETSKRHVVFVGVLARHVVFVGVLARLPSLSLSPSLLSLSCSPTILPHRFAMLCTPPPHSSCPCLSLPLPVSRPPLFSLIPASCSSRSPFSYHPSLAFSPSPPAFPRSLCHPSLALSLVEAPAWQRCPAAGWPRWASSSEVLRGAASEQQQDAAWGRHQRAYDIMLF